MLTDKKSKMCELSSLQASLFGISWSTSRSCHPLFWVCCCCLIVKSKEKGDNQRKRRQRNKKTKEKGDQGNRRPRKQNETHQENLAEVQAQLCDQTFLQVGVGVFPS